MKSNNELNKIDIKNHTCYHFDYIININDLDLDNILLDKKLYENTFFYDVAYKILFCARPLHIFFEKTDGYMRKYDETKYLVLFHSDEKYEGIFD